MSHDKIAFYFKVAHPKVAGLLKVYRKYSFCPVLLNPNLRKLKDAIVITTEYNPRLKDLDESNKLFYFIDSKLNNLEMSLLPRIDVLVSPSISKAYQLSWQIRHYGYDTKTICLTPWCETKTPIASNNHIMSYSALGEYKLAFAGFKLEKHNLTAFAHVHLSDEGGYEALDAMASGIPAIVSSRCPISEYIIHGHNGYIINSVHELIRSINDLKKNRDSISLNAYNSMIARLDPLRHIDALLHDQNLNLNSLSFAKTDIDSRKWIVREKILGEKISYFPENYGGEFRVIDLAEIIEILEYFSIQHFADVYVFGCELPPWYPQVEMFRIKALVNKLGKRAKKMHFCRDEEISQEWAQIFKKFSLISVEEGLKQVSN